MIYYALNIVQHYARRFVLIILFCLHDTPVRQVLLSPLDTGNRGFVTS